MDIVDKLRMLAVDYNLQVLDEASDEIESLRRRLQDGSPIHEATIQHMAMEIMNLKKERDELVAVAKNLVDVKGRYHTEQAYKMLEATLAKLNKETK